MNEETSQLRIARNRLNIPKENANFKDWGIIDETQNRIDKQIEKIKKQDKHNKKQADLQFETYVKKCDECEKLQSQIDEVKKKERLHILSILEHISMKMQHDKSNYNLYDEIYYFVNKILSKLEEVGK